MPKAEKETRKDLTSIQQDIKRKTIDPGTPTDVGLWAGAIDTKYRWTSHLPPLFALGFINSTVVEVATSKLLIILHQLSLSSSLSTQATKVLLASSFLFGSCALSSSCPKNESLTLVEELSIDYQPG